MLTTFIRRAFRLALIAAGSVLLFFAVWLGLIATFIAFDPLPPPGVSP
jgi:hypothetical protein